MTSIEKFKRLIELDDKNVKAKITTTAGEVYYCILDSPAEGEDDWSYHFISADYPTHYFILECNYIERIEEITDAEWQEHLNSGVEEHQ